MAEEERVLVQAGSGLLSLPFSRAARVLEVGGGERPYFRPNLDVRPLPTVDYVADLSKPWPIPSDEFDGVVGVYCIEHIAWRHVRVFISEVHRVLRPGGLAFFVTSDLLEQARSLVNSESWSDDLVCAIYGDNDYAENTHRSGFSPAYAVRLFKEAGFFAANVARHPHPQDMIIQARKSAADIRRTL